MKKIKLFFLTFVSAILVFIIYVLDSPYDKIRDYNEDFGLSPFTYLKVYKTIYPERKFESLIKKLFLDNMDIKSINITTEFCKNERLYKFIPIIEQKCILLQSYPKDSVWSVKVSGRVKRQSASNQLKLPNNICENLIKLKELQFEDSIKNMMSK